MRGPSAVRISSACVARRSARPHRGAHGQIVNLPEFRVRDRRWNGVPDLDAAAVGLLGGLGLDWDTCRRDRQASTGRSPRSRTGSPRRGVIDAIAAAPRTSAGTTT